MEDFKYDPLELQCHDFRLLRLNSRQEGELRCEIFHALLPKKYSNDAVLKFEALSYSWGGSELVNAIQVNQKELWITNNLYIALTHLRLPDQERILWIDAICINQKDLAERSQQVQMMASIYSDAERVIFWLEKATFEIKTLLISLKTLEEESIRHSAEAWDLSDRRWHDLWSKAQERCGSTNSVCVSGLQTLLQRPWFSRIWILQEVAKASRAVIHCSDWTVPSGIFILAPTLLDVEPTQQCQSVLDIMPRPYTSNSWLSSSPDLFTMLSKFSHSKATNQRDMIYALLGISSDGQSFSIDYEKSLTDTFREVFTRFFHEPSRSYRDVLDLLSEFTSLTATCLILYENPESMNDWLDSSKVIQLLKQNRKKKNQNASKTDKLFRFALMKTDNPACIKSPFVLEQQDKTDSQTCFEEIMNRGGHDSDLLGANWKTLYKSMQTALWPSVPNGLD